MAAGAAGLAVAGPAGATPVDGKSLKVAARDAGVIFGSAAGPEVFVDGPYRDLIVTQCSILVPQNAMKFDSLQPEQGRFDFGPADALVDGARAHGLMARGHNLFWNDWPPAWLPKLSHREIDKVFDTYLETVVPHFAGRLQSWDVVNEPFWLGKDKPGTFRPGAWYDALGVDYIYRAFRRTAELDPHTELVLNEAWTERADPVGLAVRKSLLNLMDRMQDRGLKLDAIGLESHLFPGVAYDASSFSDFLHAIAERHVDIYISELDVCDASFPSDIATCDGDVATWTRSYMDTVLAVPAVKLVATWGLSDRYTWWRDADPMAEASYDHLPRPLPYDDMMRPKAMQQAMVASFEGRPRAARG